MADLDVYDYTLNIDKAGLPVYNEAGELDRPDAIRRLFKLHGAYL